MRRIQFFLIVLYVSLFFMPLSCFAANIGTYSSMQLINDYNPTGGIGQGGRVYFGKERESVDQFDACWRVLDPYYANNGDSGLFLMTENLIGDLNNYNGGVVFDEDGKIADSNKILSDWKGSDGRKWCQNFMDTAFSKGEQNAILAVTKSDRSYLHNNDTIDVSFPDLQNVLEDDKVFFLSAEEAANSYYGFKFTEDRVGQFDGRDFWWWLRSTTVRDSDGNILAGAVDKNGEIVKRNVREESAARPALNVDYSRVLFTSAAVDGKVSKNVGSDALEIVPPYWDNDWKLTVIDDRYKSFKVTRSNRQGDVVSISYSGAQVGDNEYLSAILCNEDNVIKYYGRIAQIDSSAGTVKININNRDFYGDKLYVFNEQVHGDMETDYAGELIEISLKEDVKIPVAKKGLVYTGKEQVGVEPSDYYVVTNFCKVDVGTYTSICTLFDTDRYQWEDGTTAPKTITWTIQPAAIDKLSVSYNSDMDYTGLPLTQMPLVRNGDMVLIEGEDYTVNYSNNTGPGTAVMTITGKGNYKGVKTLTFSIRGSAKRIIAMMKSDETPESIKFNVLALKTTGQKKQSVSIGWKKVSGAVKYVVYGNRCGLQNKLKKLKTVSANKLTVKKIGKKKLKKGTYYKFLVMAFDRNERVVAVSKTIHVATKGGKFGNDKKVTTVATGNKVTLGQGDKFNLRAKAVAPKSKKIKVKRHRKIKYESSNESIAKVSKGGVISGVKTGTCTVYAFAQNGVCAAVTVVVK